MHATPFNLMGKTALITGSTGGIGYEMAQGLARAGCDIVLHGLEEHASVKHLQMEMERTHGVEVRYVRADLADVRAIVDMMKGLINANSAVDILVNNAVTRHFAPIESFPVDAWDNALAVNVSAAFHTIRLSLPEMRSRAWGRIFNMTSVYGSRAAVNRVDYVTTKTALLGMTRAVALETINQGITCNAICPGSVLTPDIDDRVQLLMHEKSLDREAATKLFLSGKQPIQRFVESSHVADLLVFLCGPAGRDITGTMLPVDGGWLAS